jgi:hypothetical protein
VIRGLTLRNSRGIVCINSNEAIMSEADEFTRVALEVIELFPSTPDELREWFMLEVGTHRKPGRAQLEYGLKPIQVYRLEQACRRKVEEYDAWSAMLDRAFA